MNSNEQHEMYTALVDTLTRLSADIQEDYAGEDPVWDAEEYQAYCEAVGVKRDDPIQGVLKSIERLIQSIPLPIESAEPLPASPLEIVVPQDTTPEYIGNLYKPAGQQRVMACIAVRKMDHGRGKTMLGFDTNPFQTTPWVRYYSLADCVFMFATQERAA